MVKVVFGVSIFYFKVVKDRMGAEVVLVKVFTVVGNKCYRIGIFCVLGFEIVIVIYEIYFLISTLYGIFVVFFLFWFYRILKKYGEVKIRLDGLL